MSETKELVALNADVVGYSRLLADDPHATTRAMKEYRRLVSDSVIANDGNVIDFSGDAFMALFDEPMAAMRSAIDISTQIERKNHDLDDAKRVKFRMGIDMGEVIEDADSYFGDALNIASRIQAIAPPGGVSVSSSIYAALDEPAIRFRARGEQDLKGIPERVGVYDFYDLPTEGGPPAAGGVVFEEPWIVLHPAHDVVPEVAPLVATLRADVMHRLSKIPQLGVVDAAGEAVAANIGRARYTLQIGVTQIGDQVRAYAQLMDVTALNWVKSQKVTGPESDFFDMSERLADAIGLDVEVELVIGQPAAFYAEIGDAKAIENVHQGWYDMTSFTKTGWLRSVQRFQAVVDAHPNLPFGYPLTGFVHWLGATYAWADDVGDSLKKALEFADKGVEIGDPTGMSQMVRAAALMSMGDPAGAKEALSGLSISRPTCDTTFGLLGSVRRYLGDWDESVDAEDRAMDLTGVVKPWYPTVKSCSLLLSGRVEQAATLAESLVDMAPTNLEALLVLAASQQQMGLERRARATADQIRQNFPSVDIEAWLDGNPYQDPDSVEQWKDSLRAAGVL